jgi:hypothetical protein
MSITSLLRRALYGLADITGIRFLRKLDVVLSFIENRRADKRADDVNYQYNRNQAEMTAEVANVSDGPGEQSEDSDTNFRQFIKTYRDIIDTLERKKPGLSEVAKMKSMLEAFQREWDALPAGSRDYNNWYAKLTESGRLDEFNDIYARAQVEAEK